MSSVFASSGRNAITGCRSRIPIGWVPLAATGRSVGIDRGVRALLATSDGGLIENPRHAERHRVVVRGRQRHLERVTARDAAGRVRNGRDPVRQAVVQRLARAREREANARRDGLHKISRRIVDRSAKGTVEAPGRRLRAKAGLNRASQDAGLALLLTLIREKAANAARLVVSVDARYTSQTCAVRGHVARESPRSILPVCCLMRGVG
jgi:putative transposase